MWQRCSPGTFFCGARAIGQTFLTVAMKKRRSSSRLVQLSGGHQVLAEWTWTQGRLPWIGLAPCCASTLCHTPKQLLSLLIPTHWCFVTLANTWGSSTEVFLGLLSSESIMSSLEFGRSWRQHTQHCQCSFLLLSILEQEGGRDKASCSVFSTSPAYATSPSVIDSGWCWNNTSPYACTFCPPVWIVSMYALIR